VFYPLLLHTTHEKMSAISSIEQAAPDAVPNSDEDVKVSAIDDLTSGISNVEAQIIAVEKEIKDAVKMLQSDEPRLGLEYWITKEEQLRTEKKQLRTKEEQLRTELRTEKERLSGTTTGTCLLQCVSVVLLFVRRVTHHIVCRQCHRCVCVILCAVSVYCPLLV